MYSVRMRPRFTWDAQENRENQKKHGVSFEEAATIFTSFPLQVFHDPDHSVEETRYLGVGFSDRERVLLVVHCENSQGTEIRIISARKASRRERVATFGGR